MVIKAVIFDIGGVVVRSPMLAIAKYEKEHGIPPNYINCIMCAYRLNPSSCCNIRSSTSLWSFRANQGAEGAFQKFERGETSLFPFYEAFSRELSSTNGRTWYREYCERRGLRKYKMFKQRKIWTWPGLRMSRDTWNDKDRRKRGSYFYQQAVHQD